MRNTRRLFLSVFIVLLAFIGSACSSEKGGVITSPSLDAPSISGGGGSFDGNVRPVSLVVGTWTGVETASVGESGNLSVVFSQAPTPGGAVEARITWTSAKTSLVYPGTLTGTLDAMVITASETSNPGAVCGYRATGRLNEAGTQITGSYTGVGPAPCPTKAGTFVLNGQSYQPKCEDTHLASFSKVGPTWENYTKAVPEAAKFYIRMNNGNGNGPKQNACEGRSGTWRGDSYDIPGDGSSQRYDDVCEAGSDFAGLPGVDADLIKKVVTTAKVDAAGIKVHGEVTFNNGATWKAILRASTGDAKGTFETTLQCGQTFTVNGTSAPIDTDLHYESPTAHTTSTFTIEVYKNGIRQ